MIDRKTVALYIPPSRSGPKRHLLERIGQTVGRIVRRPEGMASLHGFVPAAECFPELKPLFAQWRAEGRAFLYIDRGYLRRGNQAYAGLPKDPGNGYWRWHVGCWQMETVRDRSPNRFQRCMTQVRRWQTGGRHIVVATPTDAYEQFHGVESWLGDTLERLRQHTDREIVIRRKRDAAPLAQVLAGAHALVTHGSIAAVEAAIMGVPVFVDPVSAAKHVGLTDISKIESPVYPDRDAWLAALAYCQFDEREMVSGAMWGLLE